MDRIQLWLLIFFFIVLPLLQWILRKVTDQGAQRPQPAQRPRGQAGREIEPAGVDPVTGRPRGLQDVFREIVEEQQARFEQDDDDEAYHDDAYDDDAYENVYGDDGEQWAEVPPAPSAPVVRPQPQPQAPTRARLSAPLVSDNLVTTGVDDWGRETKREAFLQSKQLRKKGELRRIIAWREVLAPPLALRDEPGTQL